MEKFIDIFDKAARIAAIVARFITALLGITRNDD